MYASPQQFISWVAGLDSRLEDLLRGDAKDVENKVKEALQAAANEMDDSFLFRYPKVPIDFTLITDSTLRGEAQVRLEHINMQLAFRHLRLGLSSSSPLIDRQIGDAQAALNRIAGIRGTDAYGLSGRVFSTSGIPGYPGVQ